MLSMMGKGCQVPILFGTTFFALADASDLVGAAPLASQEPIHDSSPRIRPHASLAEGPGSSQFREDVLSAVIGPPSGEHPQARAISREDAKFFHDAQEAEWAPASEPVMQRCAPYDNSSPATTSMQAMYRDLASPGPAQESVSSDQAGACFYSSAISAGTAPQESAQAPAMAPGRRVSESPQKSLWARVLAGDNLFECVCCVPRDPENDFVIVAEAAPSVPSGVGGGDPLCPTGGEWAGASTGCEGRPDVGSWTAPGPGGVFDQRGCDVAQGQPRAENLIDDEFETTKGVRAVFRRPRAPSGVSDAHDHEWNIQNSDDEENRERKISRSASCPPLFGSSSTLCATFCSRNGRHLYTSVSTESDRGGDDVSEGSGAAFVSKESTIDHTFDDLVMVEENRISIIEQAPWRDVAGLPNSPRKPSNIVHYDSSPGSNTVSPLHTCISPGAEASVATTPVSTPRVRPDSTPRRTPRRDPDLKQRTSSSGLGSGLLAAFLHSAELEAMACVMQPGPRALTDERSVAASGTERMEEGPSAEANVDEAVPDEKDVDEAVPEAGHVQEEQPGYAPDAKSLAARARTQLWLGASACGDSGERQQLACLNGPFGPKGFTPSCVALRPLYAKNEPSINPASYVPDALLVSATALRSALHPVLTPQPVPQLPSLEALRDPFPFGGPNPLPREPLQCLSPRDTHERPGPSAAESSLPLGTQEERIFSFSEGGTRPTSEWETPLAIGTRVRIHRMPSDADLRNGQAATVAGFDEATHRWRVVLDESNNERQLTARNLLQL